MSLRSCRQPSTLGQGSACEALKTQWRLLSILRTPALPDSDPRLIAGTGRARALVRRARAERGIFTSPDCAAPVTVGWLRPVILLPLNWRSWPAAELDVVLIHEREHVRRRDPLIRHSSLLHALGVDLKVQQELLRHADIRTTMNIYTHAVPAALREANSKVVRLVLPAQVA